MKKFINFLTYNNAVPIALGVLFLGAGGALAASPAAQQAVYASQVLTQSVDNSRIATADLDTYAFPVQVVAVTEDETSYFVDYTLGTIELVNGVWQDITKQLTLTVAKDLLGGKDLGLYATTQLAEVRDRERARLKETQVIEQGIGVSQKVVATVYSGLIGAMLSAETETFPTYQAAVVEQLPVFLPTAGTPLVSSSDVQPGTSPSSSQGGDTQPPALTLVGGSPVRITLNTLYIDEGVVVTDNASAVPSLEVTVDGRAVDEVTLDTSKVWTYLIVYTATDASGNDSSVTREVVVGGEGAPVPPPAGDNGGGEEPATTTPET